MPTRKPPNIPSSEITSEQFYFNRRMFMRGAVLAGSVAATGLHFFWPYCWDSELLQDITRTAANSE